MDWRICAALRRADGIELLTGLAVAGKLAPGAPHLRELLRHDAALGLGTLVITQAS